MLDDGGQMVTGAAGGELAPGLDDGGQVVTGAAAASWRPGSIEAARARSSRARLAPVLDDGGQVVTGAAAASWRPGSMTAARWSPVPRGRRAGGRARRRRAGSRRAVLDDGGRGRSGRPGELAAASTAPGPIEAAGLDPRPRARRRPGRAGARVRSRRPVHDAPGLGWRLCSMTAARWSPVPRRRAGGCARRRRAGSRRPVLDDGGRGRSGRPGELAAGLDGAGPDRGGWARSRGPGLDGGRASWRPGSMTAARWSPAPAAGELAAGPDRPARSWPGPMTAAAADRAPVLDDGGQGGHRCRGGELAAVLDGGRASWRPGSMTAARWSPVPRRRAGGRARRRRGRSRRLGSILRPGSTAAAADRAPVLDDSGPMVTGAAGGELAAGFDRGGPCTILPGSAGACAR